MQHIKTKVKVEFWQKSLILNKVFLLKRITYTPSEKEFIVDYGINIFGLYLWISFPDKMLLSP